jgi:hypothetical protein
MGELNAGGSTLRMQELGNAAQGIDLLVVPQPDIGIGDPALGRHRRRLDDDEPEAADAEAGEMGEVPVVGDAVPRRILAHRRHDQPILECEAARCEGGKELAHGSYLSEKDGRR